jgi:hypothetical protein
MDLSGLYIKGTGSYEVKEIAPASVVGNAALNENFENWTADNPDGWTVGAEDSGGYVTEVANGARFVRTTTSLVLYQASRLIVGRNYRARVIVDEINVVGSRLNMNNSSTANGDQIGIVNKLGLNEFFFKAVHVSFNLYMITYACDIVISKIIVEEIPEGYPLLDKGSTYLECTSEGIVAFPSTQAYGEWEFDLYKATQVLFYLTEDYADPGNADGYRIDFAVAGSITLRRRNTAIVLMSSADAYMEDDTWYRCKLTRTLDGVFTLYIKGGDFGISDWTLVDVSGGSGTNPATDNTHTKLSYIAPTANVGDRIANIIMRKAVQQ